MAQKKTAPPETLRNADGSERLIYCRTNLKGYGPKDQTLPVSQVFTVFGWEPGKRRNCTPSFGVPVRDWRFRFLAENGRFTGPEMTYSEFNAWRAAATKRDRASDANDDRPSKEESEP